MLLVDKNDSVKIEISYEETPQGPKYVEGPTNSELNLKTETFYFRRPNWGDIRRIMSESSVPRPDGDGFILNTWKFMDLRIKYLLKEWTLKDKDGVLSITSENIDNLNPDLISKLSNKLNEVLSS